jgi:catechol 2,3-dioxygenase-like lactoylglutathione lyase family enzyme
VSADDKTEASEVKEESTVLKIKVASLIVDDQDKAEKFYTEVLGFEVKENIPVGEFRWLTVVSPDNRDGTELALEPNDNPAAKTFQKAIFDQGMPATMFFVEDLQKTHEKLAELGVVFTVQPKDMGGTFAAIFDDTCGNLIMIAQE